MFSPSKKKYVDCMRRQDDAKLLGQAILAKLRLVSRSHIVHSGKDLWKPGVEKLDPSKVPGLRKPGHITYAPCRHS